GCTACLPLRRGRLAGGDLLPPGPPGRGGGIVEGGGRALGGGGDGGRRPPHGEGSAGRPGLRAEPRLAKRHPGGGEAADPRLNALGSGAPHVPRARATAAAATVRRRLRLASEAAVGHGSGTVHRRGRAGGPAFPCSPTPPPAAPSPPARRAPA